MYSNSQQFILFPLLHGFSSCMVWFALLVEIKTIYWMHGPYIKINLTHHVFIWFYTEITVQANPRIRGFSIRGFS